MKKQNGDQKPGFDNSAYPVEFLNSGNDPIADSERRFYVQQIAAVTDLKSVSKSVWGPSEAAPQ